MVTVAYDQFFHGLLDNFSGAFVDVVFQAPQTVVVKQGCAR